MDMRKIKAEQIVKEKGITKTDRGWAVHSQSGRGNYLVERRGEALVCTCPDFQLRNQPCKHVIAIQLITLQWFDAKGNKILEVKRVSYPQNWSAYNASQINEKSLFMKFLSDLCDNIENKVIPMGKAGRHNLPLKDMVFSSALKVYTTFSLRRFISDMKIAKEKGFVNNVCSYSSVSNYMRSSSLTPILHDLIMLSSMPLRSAESKFAVDSSGFRTTKFNDYCKDRYTPNKKHNWVKIHICTGVKTNIITAVEITNEKGGDSPQFIPLVNSTANAGFTLNEVSADKAYNSADNYNAINEFGGTAYIPYRNNITAIAHTGSRAKLWRRMFNYFVYNREEFLHHYHLRSNVESTFNMLKAKFTDLIRSKDEVAQINEALLKVLCHNIVIVIHEMNELGIEPNFVK